MAIDKNLIEPLISAYTTWVDHHKAQLADNENFKEVVQMIKHIEELAEKHSDFVAFYADLEKESLLHNISKMIANTVGAQISSQSESTQTNSSDEAMIANFINNYEASLQQLKSTSEKLEPNARHKFVDVLPVLRALEENISLAKTPGITSPKIFATQIEKGLDKALEGQSMKRDAFEFYVKFNEVAKSSPYEIELAKCNLAFYDKLASKSAFSIPNSKILYFGTRGNEMEFENRIFYWNRINSEIDEITSSLFYWILSFCKFAPKLVPWLHNPDPHKAVLKTQETTPVYFSKKMQVIQKYFGLTIKTLLNTEVMDWQVKHKLLSNSQVITEFLISEIFPLCISNTKPPSKTVKKMEDFFHKQMFFNPELGILDEKVRQLLKQYFPSVTQDVEQIGEKGNAASWDYDSWKNFVAQLEV